MNYASGILFVQNNDGPYKWTKGPFPIQINANFRNFDGHLNFGCHLKDLMG